MTNSNRIAKTALATCLNVILPGLGHIATGKFIIGPILIVCWILAGMYLCAGQYRAIYAAGIIWLGAMIDAAARTK